MNYDFVIFALNINGGGGEAQLDLLLRYIKEELKGRKILLLVNTLKKLDLDDCNIFSVKKFKWVNRSIPIKLYSIFKCWLFLKNAKFKSVYYPGGTIYFPQYTSIISFRNLLPFDSINIRKLSSYKLQLKFYTLRFLLSFSFHYCSGVIYLSRFSYNYLKSVTSVNISKGVCINHCIDPKQQSISYNRSRTGIVYVSSFFPYKNHNIVLRFYEQAVKLGCSEKLTLVGDGPCVEIIKKQINNSEILKLNVTIVKHLNKKCLYQFLMTQKLAIFGSDCETFGQTLLDYLYCQVPIFGLHTNILNEVTLGNYIGYNGNNSYNIAGLFNEALLDYKKLKALAENGHKIVQRYMGNKMASRTVSFIDSIY